MKTILSLLVLILFGTGIANATPLTAYYTFDIEVSSIDDSAGLFAAGGIEVNNNYDFTLLLTPTGESTYLPGPATWWDYDVKFISGPSYYDGAVGDTQNLPYGPGFDNGEGYVRFGSVVIGDTSGPFVDQWAVGMSFEAGQPTFSSDWWGGIATLTSVEAADPVPEPATMFLFGTGLVGLLGMASRKKK